MDITTLALAKNYTDKSIQDAVLGDITTDSVKYSKQTLNNEQQAQARQNIGAMPDNLIKVVNFTYTQGQDKDGLIADATAEEIYTALRQGKLVFAFVNNEHFPHLDTTATIFTPIYAYSSEDMLFNVFGTSYSYVGDTISDGGGTYEYWGEY